MNLKFNFKLNFKFKLKVEQKVIYLNLTRCGHGATGSYGVALRNVNLKLLIDLRLPPFNLNLKLTSS